MSIPRGKLKQIHEAFNDVACILEECTDDGVCAKLWEHLNNELGRDVPTYVVTGPHIIGVQYHNDLIPAVACWLSQFVQSARREEVTRNG